MGPHASSPAPSAPHFAAWVPRAGEPEVVALLTYLWAKVTDTVINGLGDSLRIRAATGVRLSRKLAA